MPCCFCNSPSKYNSCVKCTTDKFAEKGEIFKKAKYPGYMVSSNGRIISRKTFKELSQVIVGGGYKACMLSVNGLKILEKVHRLIAFAFVKNEDIKKYKIVDHIDGNRTNNNINNLRWVNSSTNVLNTISVPRVEVTIYYVNKKNEKVIEKYKSLNEAEDRLKTIECRGYGDI